MNETSRIAASRIAAPALVDLASLKMAELWEVWDHYFPRRPERPNRTYIESQLIYKIQEQMHGGLSARTRERLQAIGQRHSKIKLRAKRKEFQFAPGTVLLREWHERELRVTVNADGQFDYEGQTFKSLTAVARHITGSHWSGPLFFGLSQGTT